jgi:hypothetical protein
MVSLLPSESAPLERTERPEGSVFDAENVCERLAKILSDDELGRYIR